MASNPDVLSKTKVLFDLSSEEKTDHGYKAVEEPASRAYQSKIPKAPPVDLPDPVLAENAVTVLKRRYLQKDEQGNVIETPKQMFWRVAKTVAANDKVYDPDVDIVREARQYYMMMASLDFLPNSPTLMNAGRKLGQLSACFVLPVEDSMEGIFEAVKQAALVHKSGGGTGFSFSRLRPKHAQVASTHGTASGPVSFMKVFNAATETIKQGGTRRGANMGILRVDHPDILEFITCKKDMVSITNFNISVGITDKFMSAYEQGGDYNLIDPRTNQVVCKENARKVFDLIADNAWLNGDPGLIFLDEINRKEKTPQVGRIEATNPCGEQPLLAYESCNLGSINLNNMLTPRKVMDWDHLQNVVRRSVRFLVNIIDLNKYPIEQISNTTKANRRIGLGVMGFADMLYALEIPYNSEEAIDMARNVKFFIDTEARKMSDELASERGQFPNCEGSTFDHPTRNSTVTTIAPTGTISMIANTSGGVEPNFSLVYVKRVMDDDRLLYVNPRFFDAAQSGGFYSKELMEELAAGKKLTEIDSIPEDVKDVFTTAHDISPEWHIRMQAAFQENCENAVSKTINFPHDATVDNVKDAYLLAWKLRCKGITIYRDGSRDVQVMNVGNKLAKANETETSQVSESKDQDTSSEKTAVTSEIKENTPAPAQPFQELRSTKLYSKPRKRPSMTRGYTQHILTGEGSLYVTINEDDQGLCEVFASIGKSGGNAAAQSEAVGRLISLALRSGVDPHSIVKQLKGITGANPAWNDGVLIRSTPDAIGWALERHLAQRKQQQTELLLVAESGASESGTAFKTPRENPESDKPKITYANGVKVREQCPDCQSPLVFEEGCMSCKSCGFSKCE